MLSHPVGENTGAPTTQLPGTPYLTGPSLGGGNHYSYSFKNKNDFGGGGGERTMAGVRTSPLIITFCIAAMCSGGQEVRVFLSSGW